MASTYIIDCAFCPKKFKSFSTLKKHFIIKHPGNEWEGITPIFKDANNSAIASLPEAKELSGKDQFKNYKVWLAGLVERINCAFHPRLPGKLCFKIDAYTFE